MEKVGEPLPAPSEVWRALLVVKPPSEVMKSVKVAQSGLEVINSWFEIWFDRS